MHIQECSHLTAKNVSIPLVCQSESSSKTVFSFPPVSPTLLINVSSLTKQSLKKASVQSLKLQWPHLFLTLFLTSSAEDWMRIRGFGEGKMGVGLLNPSRRSMALMSSDSSKAENCARYSGKYSLARSTGSFTLWLYRDLPCKWIFLLIFWNFSVLRLGWALT